MDTNGVFFNQGGRESHFLSAASLCPLSASRFPGLFAHPNELFCVGRTPENSGSCFPTLHVSVSEEHFILKINGYRFAAATRTRFIMCFSFFKSSPRCYPHLKPLQLKFPNGPLCLVLKDNSALLQLCPPPSPQYDNNDAQML